MRARLTLTGLLLLTCAPSLLAQTPPPAVPAAPAYQVLRFDEDWSFLKDRSRRADFWDPLKYIPLNDRGWYASLGAEVRERYEGYVHSGFGAGPQDPNGYLLQRYLGHADVHTGAHIRFFTQLQSGLAVGRVGGPRALGDKDQFEFHQAFADIKIGTAPKKTAFVRFGRQEFEFGSGRLISSGELLNVRRSFDGVRLSGQFGQWTFHSIAARPVATNPGALDDKADHAQKVWGAGVVHPNPRANGGYFSVYYIGFDRREGRFDSGVGREGRHTLGSRVFGTGANWDYNYEVIAQWGSFQNHPIRAWAISTDTGRSLVKAAFRPRFGIKADVGSGDQDAKDETLQTFNPLFPNTAYSGKIGLLGPQNIVDVEPGVRLRPTPRITATAEWGFFWRESLHDGIYGLSLSPFKTGQVSRSRYVANQPDLQVSFAVDRHLTVVGILTQFRTASFIKDTPPSRNIGYATLYFTYKF